MSAVGPTAREIAGRRTIGLLIFSLIALAVATAVAFVQVLRDAELEDPVTLAALTAGLGAFVLSMALLLLMSFRLVRGRPDRWMLLVTVVLCFFAPPVGFVWLIFHVMYVAAWQEDRAAQRGVTQDGRSSKTPRRVSR